MKSSEMVQATGSAISMRDIVGAASCNGFKDVDTVGRSSACSTGAICLLFSKGWASGAGLEAGCTQMVGRSLSADGLLGRSNDGRRKGEKKRRLMTRQISQAIITSSQQKASSQQTVTRSTSMLTRNEERKEWEDGVLVVLVVFHQVLRVELRVLVKVEILAVLKLMADCLVVVFDGGMG